MKFAIKQNASNGVPRNRSLDPNCYRWRDGRKAAIDRRFANTFSSKRSQKSHGIAGAAPYYHRRERVARQIFVPFSRKGSVNGLDPMRSIPIRDSHGSGTVSWRVRCAKVR